MQFVFVCKKKQFSQTEGNVSKTSIDKAEKINGFCVCVCVVDKVATHEAAKARRCFCLVLENG